MKLGNKNRALPPFFGRDAQQPSFRNGSEAYLACIRAVHLEILGQHCYSDFIGRFTSAEYTSRVNLDGLRIGAALRYRPGCFKGSPIACFWESMTSLASVSLLREGIGNRHRPDLKK